MNILFLHPIQLYRRWPIPTDLTRFNFNQPPLTFPQLAAYLSEDYQCDIVDGVVEKIRISEFKKIIEKKDVVAINVHHSGASLNTELNIRLIKHINPRVKIIMGGLQATVFAEEWLQKGADIIVRAEGDISFSKVMLALKEGTDLSPILGISYLHNGAVYHNPDQPFITDLDSLAMPKWEMINWRNYGTDNRDGFTATVELSRGCAFNCNFCLVQHVWKGQRYKSVNRVIDELFVLKEHGVTKVWFDEENFGYQHDRDLALIQEMIQKNINMRWYCFSRADHIIAHPDFYRLAAKAGMKCILIGYETMHSETNNAFYKKESSQNLSVKSYQEIYRFLKRCGVFSIGLFMIGHPKESTSDVLDTLSQCRNVCDFPLISPLRPERGTDTYSLFKDGQSEELFYYDAHIKISHFERFKKIWKMATLLSFIRPLRKIYSKDRFERVFYRSLYAYLLNAVMAINLNNLKDLFYFVFLYPGGMSYEIYKQRIVNRYLRYIHELCRKLN